ncbi:MAG: putative amino acid antiporter [Francisellaceae bacterium]|nr:putative amino acid antiporter [Francisellaceae bacterium]
MLKQPLPNKKTKPILSVFGLVMLNVIAVDSLRTLPISAKYGSSLVFYYCICTLLFLIPVALITAELSTAWPKKGGIYHWVKEAFGEKWGFLTVWLQWIYNLVWYPTILGFVAATLAYVFAPHLLNNKLYIISTILIIFWGATFLNCLGMRVTSIISTLASIVGTLLPMLVMIILSIIWLVKGNPSQISFSLKSLLPNFKQIKFSDLVLINSILFGLIGLEMSSVHADEVKNPATEYPKALLISAMVIVISLVCASSAIAIVLPVEEIDIVTAMIEAFARFFASFHLSFLTPVLALSMIIGAVGGVTTWIIGPTKALLAAAQDKNFSWLKRTNKVDVPYNILLVQGIIVTILSLAYVLWPKIESSYWALTELTAILALLMYIIVFSAAIRLRYTHNQVLRPFKIPGKNLGMWIVGGVGIISCVLGVLIGFIPPSQVELGQIQHYQSILLLSVVVFCIPVFFFIKNNQCKTLEQES